jgi:23S rRNA pseudouridine1911/1915/1917 synthase
MSELISKKAERLDQFVARLVPEHSRAFAEKLIDQGRVLVNGKMVKNGYKLRTSDKVEVDYDEKAVNIIPEIDIPIIYEDKSCVVIDKPVGILSHSKGEFNPEATVASWLSSRVKGLSGDRAGIVHRLDRATSGVMICAKTPEAMSWLQKQFSSRKVKKVYTAIVSGTLAQPVAIIDMPIERNPKKPQTFRVGANGKSAVTAYKVLASSDKRSLIELRPTTGRTHQLRVHLRHLDLPILGDTFYGGKESDRLYLHASSLEITLPSKERKVFESPLPTNFKKQME